MYLLHHQQDLSAPGSLHDIALRLILFDFSGFTSNVQTIYLTVAFQVFSKKKAPHFRERLIGASLLHLDSNQGHPD